MRRRKRQREDRYYYRRYNPHIRIKVIYLYTILISSVRF
jgi:hypothetical protein